MYFIIWNFRYFNFFINLIIEKFSIESQNTIMMILHYTRRKTTGMFYIIGAKRWNTGILNWYNTFLKDSVWHHRLAHLHTDHFMHLLVNYNHCFVKLQYILQYYSTCKTLIMPHNFLILHYIVMKLLVLCLFDFLLQINLKSSWTWPLSSLQTVCVGHLWQPLFPLSYISGVRLGCIVHVHVQCMYCTCSASM